MNSRSVRPHTCWIGAGAEDRPDDARIAPTETSRSTATTSRSIRWGYRWSLNPPPSLVWDRASIQADGANPGGKGRGPADGGRDRPRPPRQPSARATQRPPNAGAASKKDAPVLEHLAHPDRLVGRNRGGVLGPDEERDGRGGIQ